MYFKPKMQFYLPITKTTYSTYNKTIEGRRERSIEEGSERGGERKVSINQN
jgi:hypothetical protein